MRAHPISTSAGTQPNFLFTESKLAATYCQQFTSRKFKYASLNFDFLVYSKYRVVSIAVFLTISIRESVAKNARAGRAGQARYDK